MKKTQLLLILFFLNIILIIIFFISKVYFQPVTVVVPHHNIVKEKRLEFFKIIAKKRPVTKTIIILSPDHFSPQQLNLSYSNLYSKKIVTKLSPLLSLQNGVIQNDHGIFNLLPDINSVWPKAEIFPILIGQDYPVSGLNDLIKKLDQICGFDCLLISSVDFSHYLPAAFANVHDQKSIYDLSTQNLEEISKLEVDSPQSLYILAKFSQLKNAHNWNLFYHSNSGEIVSNPDIETTSHVFGSYQKSFSKNNIPPVKTYLITKNIDKNKSLSSLGTRFFYGTDFIDLNYSSKSSFKLPFDLPDNTIVISTTTNNQPAFNFFPTETKNGATYFLRGEAKIKQLNIILKNINNANI